MFDVGLRKRFSHSSGNLDEVRGTIVGSLAIEVNLKHSMYNGSYLGRHKRLQTLYEQSQTSTFLPVDCRKNLKSPNPFREFFDTLGRF